MIKILLSTSDNINFTSSISSIAKCELKTIKITKYSGNEILASFDNKINSSDKYFLFHKFWPNPNEAIIELLLILDSLSRSKINNITLITPYLPYLRQDRQLEHNSSIGASMLAKLIENSIIDKIITIDPHSDNALAYFNNRIVSLDISTVYANYIKTKMNFENLLLVAPDKGCSNKVKDIASLINCPYLILNKNRTTENDIVSKASNIDFKQFKNVILIDDIIDTGKTVISAVKVLPASLNYFVIGTHALSENYIQNLCETKIFKKIIYTNSTISDLYLKIPTVEEIDLSQILAKAII